MTDVDIVADILARAGFGNMRTVDGEFVPCNLTGMHRQVAVEILHALRKAGVVAVQRKGSQ